MFIIDTIYSLHGTEKYLLNFVKRLDKERFVPVIVSLDHRDSVAEEFYLLNVPIISLPIKKLYSPLSVVKYIKLYRFIKKYKIDIIETIHRTSDLVGPVIGRFAGVKKIISNRRDMGFMRTCRDDSAYRIVDRFVDRIKCNSYAAAKYFSRLEHLPIEKFDVMYNGVGIDTNYVSDSEKSGLRIKYGIKEEELVVGIVGGIKKVKGHIEFLEMAKIISEEHDNVKFIIVGGRSKLNGDEYYDGIRQLCMDKGLGEKVIFTGFIKDTPGITSLFDIAVLSSYTEGCSNALLEYMAMGKPVIATVVGGNSELVVDGETGYLVPPKDAQMLAEKVNLLLNSDINRQTMGIKGRKRAAEKYDISNIVNENMEYYSQLFTYS